VVGCRCRASGTAAGTGVVFAGLAFAGLGVWARREVRRGLERERISTPDGKAVTSAAAARGLADLIREQTLESAGGKTYAETGEYLVEDGSTTSDVTKAMKDEATESPVTNPDVELWLRSTTLQTALMQAYMAFRISDLMLGVGGALTLAGAGIATSARR
jgi:hypothetical protein